MIRIDDMICCYRFNYSTVFKVAVISSTSTSSTLCSNISNNECKLISFNTDRGRSA